MISSIHGDPVWGWMEHFIHLLPNQYIDTAEFCGRGPSTVEPLVIADFLNLEQAGSPEWIAKEVDLVGKVGVALYDRLFGAMCHLAPPVDQVGWSDPVCRTGTTTTAFGMLGAMPIPAGATQMRIVVTNATSPADLNATVQMVNAAGTAAEDGGAWNGQQGVINTFNVHAAPYNGNVWLEWHISGTTATECYSFYGAGIGAPSLHDPTPQPQPDDLPVRVVPPTDSVTDLAPLLFDLEQKMERALAFIQHTNSVVEPRLPVTLGAPILPVPLDTAFPPGTPDVPWGAFARPDNAVGLIVDCTTVPSTLARYGVAPFYYPSLVHLLPITALGPLEGIRITRNPQAILSLPRSVTSVVLDPQPGVVATVQWLIAPF